eukprot:279297-Chlamydomonas_euryale.AAC.5
MALLHTGQLLPRRSDEQGITSPYLPHTCPTHAPRSAITSSLCPLARPSAHCRPPPTSRVTDSPPPSLINNLHAVSARPPCAARDPSLHCTIQGLGTSKVWLVDTGQKFQAAKNGTKSWGEGAPLEDATFPRPTHAGVQQQRPLHDDARPDGAGQHGRVDRRAGRRRRVVPQDWPVGSLPGVNACVHQNGTPHGERGDGRLRGVARQRRAPDRHAEMEAGA